MSADYSNYIVNESGIANFDKTTLQKMLVGKTVSVGPYVDELKEGFSGTCAPADLETMLQLVNLYFTKPRKSLDDFNSLMNKEHGQYDHILDNPQYYFIDKLQHVVYSNSIRRGLPTEDKLNKIDFEKAFNIYKERFSNAADFTFVFVGNVDMQKLKPLLESYLGSLPTTPQRETWKDPNINKPSGVVSTKLKMGNTPKSLVAIHYHGKMPWTEQDEYNFNSLTKVLNITLRESLREDKSGVYGVSVNGAFSRRPQERYGINIQFNVDPTRTDELIQLVYSKIDEIKNTGTTEEKVNKVKETQRRERETDWKENGFWLSNIEYYDTYHTDISKLNDYPKLIDGLTTKSIQDAAKKYLSGENRIEVVLEPNK
jgi:zinc protease